MKKKIVSLMLTGVLLAGMPLTVSAAPPDDLPADTTVDNLGTIKYLNVVKYQVTLPTANSMNFDVDPQGYLSESYKTAYPDGTTGMILAKGDQGAYVRNESSVPIKMTIEAYVASDNAGAASKVNLMETADNVDSGIDLNMYLALDITNDDVAEALNKAADGTAGVALVKANAVNAEVLPVMTNGKTGTIPTQITFALDKGTWEIDSTGNNIEYKDNTGDAVGLRLSGRVNVNADWSDFTTKTPTPDELHVTTVYKFKDLGVAYDNAALDGRAHGTLEDIDPVYYEGEGEEFVTGGSALIIPFNLGSGTKEVSVSKIEIGSTVIPAAEYKAYNGEIIFMSTGTNVKTEIVEKATEAGADVTLKITTTDGAATPTTKVTNVTVKVFKPEE